MTDTTTAGYGQLTPEDAGSDLDVISFTIRQTLAQVDTAKVVKIIAVHPGSGSPPGAGTVDVQPLVNQIDGNGFSVPHGVIYGLPYARMQAGGFAVVADPAVGDKGVVVCADRDISSVTANSGTVSNPGSRRKHNIADGVYFGAGGVYGTSPTSYIQVNSDGTLKIADSQGNVILTSASGITFTPAGGTMTVVGTIAVTGGVVVSGAVIAGFGGGDQVGLQTHVHTANNTPPTAGT